MISNVKRLINNDNGWKQLYYTFVKDAKDYIYYSDQDQQITEVLSSDVHSYGDGELYIVHKYLPLCPANPTKGIEAFWKLILLGAAE